MVFGDLFESESPLDDVPCQVRSIGINHTTEVRNDVVLPVTADEIVNVRLRLVI